MIILSADTSGDRFGLALCEDGSILESFRSGTANAHSVDMLPEIERLLASGGFRPKDIGLFCVGLGPGSFTGLRIGITMMRAMAFALKKPIAGVPSIDAIAHNAVVSNPLVCVIKDARQSKVYARFYKAKSGKAISLGRIMLLDMDNLLSLVKGRMYFIGDAIDIYKETIMRAGFTGKDLAPRETWQPDPGIIAMLGRDKASAGLKDNVFGLTPLYIYPKECQIRRQPPRRGLKVMVF